MLKFDGYSALEHRFPMSDSDWYQPSGTHQQEGHHSLVSLTDTISNAIIMSIFAIDRA